MSATESARPFRTVPRRRALLQQLAERFREFLSTEAGSAGLLLAAAVTALVWANSSLSDSYNSLLLAAGCGPAYVMTQWDTRFSIPTGTANHVG